MGRGSNDLKAKAPILDPAFVWIPAASHDADSTLFRQRQLARMAAAQKARAEANENVVQPIRKGRK